MRTLYDGVYQVPPGHYLLATEKHIRLFQYWDFHYSKTGADADHRSVSACVLQERLHLTA